MIYFNPRGGHLPNPFREEEEKMIRLNRKLAEVTKLSVRAQLTINREEKVAYLIGVLEMIAKGTKYEMTVMDAIKDFYKDTTFGDNPNLLEG